MKSWQLNSIEGTEQRVKQLYAPLDQTRQKNKSSKYFDARILKIIQLILYIHTYIHTLLQLPTRVFQYQDDRNRLIGGIWF